MDQNKFDEIFKSVYIVQDRIEFKTLLDDVEALNPKNILEIGVERGGTLRFWSEILQVGGKLIGVDIEPLQLSWDTYLVKDKFVRRIAGDSKDTKMVNSIWREFGFLDFLFIDGGHTYEDVMADFNNYSPLVRAGGIIGFHDLPGEPGVKMAWDKISPLFKDKRTIHKSIGIGYIYK